MSTIIQTQIVIWVVLIIYGLVFEINLIYPLFITPNPGISLFRRTIGMVIFTSLGLATEVLLYNSLQDIVRKTG